MPVKVGITGGGSAGHVVPTLGLANRILAVIATKVLVSSESTRVRVPFRRIRPICTGLPNVSRLDMAYRPPALQRPALRRRPVDERAAA